MEVAYHLRLWLYVLSFGGTLFISRPIVIIVIIYGVLMKS